MHPQHALLPRPCNTLASKPACTARDARTALPDTGPQPPCAGRGHTSAALFRAGPNRSQPAPGGEQTLQVKPQGWALLAARSTLPEVRSRCTQPFSCRYAMPCAISRPQVTTATMSGLAVPYPAFLVNSQPRSFASCADKFLGQPAAIVCILFRQE